MKGKAVSLPQLSLLTEDGEERSLEAEGRGVLSPLAPRLAPTLRTATLSPFWFQSGPAPPPQVPGSTSSSPGEAPRAAAFSLLHAAAITGEITDPREFL